MGQFKNYSNYYDLIYKDKDYRKETVFIEKSLVRFSHPKPKSILSLGCGTCSYEILLAKKGYDITGIDLSKDMLEIASEKIKKLKLKSKISISNKNVQDFSFKKKSDAAIAMFNIVGYQTQNKQIKDMLRCVNKNLKKGGIFMFDCWYMPAVLKDKPTDRIKEIKVGNKRIIRLTKSVLHLAEKVVEINFRVLELSNNKLISEVEETHRVRFWSFPELKSLLQKSGFLLAHASNFMDLNSPISDDNWNIFIVARKK